MSSQTQTKSADTATHCPYCAFQCGMSISLSSGQPEVAGDPEFPVNRGALCVKGWTSVGTLAHPDRLLTPLIRAADGDLKPASWEAALDRVIEGVRSAQERYGTDVVGPAAHGAPNFVDKTIWTGGNLDIGQATALCRKSRLP